MRKTISLLLAAIFTVFSVFLGACTSTTPVNNATTEKPNVVATTPSTPASTPATTTPAASPNTSPAASPAKTGTSPEVKKADDKNVNKDVKPAVPTPKTN